MTQGTQKSKNKIKTTIFGVLAANQSQIELNWHIASIL